MNWERARQPEQIESRRQAILGAAARVYEEVGLDRATLSAVARSAGVSKASIYRYFESREEIFLHLLLADQSRFVTELERRLALLAERSDIDAVAVQFADVVLAQPRYAALSAKLTSVLEHNVSADTLRNFKRAYIGVALRLVNAICVVFPRLDVARARRFIMYHMVFAQGLYPNAHPPPEVQKIMQEPEFAEMCVDERAFLEDHVRILLVGLLSAREG